MKTILLFSLLLLSNFIVNAQQITVLKGISLPSDSVVSQQLLVSLNEFIKEKNHAFKELETLTSTNINANSILIEAMQNIEINDKDSSFYKPYLINVLPINKTDFEVEIAFMNDTDLKGVFSLLARKQVDKFLFESPLERNTFGWKTQNFGKVTYYYINEINQKKAKNFNDKYLLYNKKLGTTPENINFYSFKDVNDALKNVGVLYYKDYNGMQNNVFVANETTPNLYLNGYSYLPEGDEHDLFHDCVAKVLDKTKAYRPVNEGTAYLYGGSWYYTTAEIKELLKNYAKQNSDANWLELYKKNAWLNSDKSAYLLIPYAINMLLVDKIEKEKGFSKVIELMSCGKRQKDEKNYLDSLNKTIGINEGNFNAEINSLIEK